MYRRLHRGASALNGCFWILGIGSFLSMMNYGGVFSFAYLVASIMGIIGISSIRSVFAELVAAADPDVSAPAKSFVLQSAPQPMAVKRVSEEPPHVEMYRNMQSSTAATKPVRQPVKKAAPAMNIDWEEWVGQKLLQKAGVLIVLVGMLVFLKYSFDNKWIDELGRVVLSVIGAGALLIAGEYFHEKYAKWSHAFTGGGLVLLYLTVWVAHVLYAQELAQSYSIVVPAGVAFLLNSFITLLGAVAAVRYKSQVIAWFTVLGGYLTPLLVNSPTPDLTALLLYLAVLAGGLLLLAWHSKWKHINAAAFFFTQFYLFSAVYTAVPEFGDAEQVVTASAFFLIFNILPLLYQFRLKEKADHEGIVLIILNGLAVFLPVVDALGGWSSGYVGIVCFLLAAFYLLFSAAALGKRGDDEALVNTYLVGTVILVAGGLFAELEREWVAVGWAPLSLLLAFITSRMPRKGAWVCSLLLLAGSLLFLALNIPTNAGPEAIWHPFTSNWAIQSYVVFAMVMGWIALSKNIPASVLPAETSVSFKNILHTALAVILFFAVTFEATGLDFTIDLVWTFAYVGLGVAAIAIFFLTESIVWFVAAFVAQILALLFIFRFADGSGMAAFADHSVRPFMHPWGYLSLVALLASFVMAYVARLKQNVFTAGVRADLLLVIVAAAQVWTHVSVEIMNLRSAYDIAYLPGDRMLSAWWIVFALVTLAYAVLRKYPKLAYPSLLLFAIPFVHNHFAILEGQERMLETIVWTALSLGIAITGARTKWPILLRGGMLLLFLAMGTDMVSHLGDSSAGLFRSVWWALAGLVTMIAGFMEREKQLRQLAMVIFGATVIKLLLVDFSGLETPVRIGASVVTGLLMIGASYLYQRFDTSAAPAAIPSRKK